MRVGQALMVGVFYVLVVISAVIFLVGVSRAFLRR
jgi:hypothetical protein